MGLFVGFELVRDRATRDPDAALAGELVNRAAERGVLLSTDGPDHDVIKIKPPLVFSAADADRLVETVDAVLSEIAAG
jgi:4-aminobutyrate aminotransferase-like enzyme